MKLFNMCIVVVLALVLLLSSSCRKQAVSTNGCGTCPKWHWLSDSLARLYINPVQDLDSPNKNQLFKKKYIQAINACFCHYGSSVEVLSYHILCLNPKYVNGVEWRNFPNLIYINIDRWYKAPYNLRKYKGKLTHQQKQNWYDLMALPKLKNIELDLLPHELFVLDEIAKHPNKFHDIRIYTYPYKDGSMPAFERLDTLLKAIAASQQDSLEYISFDFPFSTVNKEPIYLFEEMKGLPNIKWIDINNRRDKDSVLFRLSPRFHQLKQLEYLYVPLDLFDMANVEQLAQLPNLKRLGNNGYGRADANLPAKKLPPSFAQLSKLEALYFRSAHPIELDASFAQLSNLKTLFIAVDLTSPEQFEIIKRLKSLEKLYCYHSYSVSETKQLIQTVRAAFPEQVPEISWSCPDCRKEDFPPEKGIKVYFHNKRRL